MKNRGLSLVEVILAMMIIIMVSLACLQVLQANSRATISVFKRIQASQYTDRIHDLLQRSNITTLGEHYNQFPQVGLADGFSVEVKILPAQEFKPRLTTITVRWNDNGRYKNLVTDVTLVPQ